MRVDLSLGRDTARARREPSKRLRQALLELAGRKATIRNHEEKRWSSVTFVGARHRIELEFEGSGAEAGELFIALLPEHEFVLPGQLVADAAVTEVDHRLEPPRLQVTCELLLLDEG